MLPADQLAQLTDTLRADGLCQELLRDIERLHRVVFHSSATADWSRAGKSAEQIILADVAMRHDGDLQKLHAEYAQNQQAGRSNDEARQTIAARLHSYYTTPLGITIRRDLFGDDAVFFVPEAAEWLSGGSAADRPQTTDPTRNKA